MAAFGPAEGPGAAQQWEEGGTLALDPALARLRVREMRGESEG